MTSTKLRGTESLSPARPSDTPQNPLTALIADDDGEKAKRPFKAIVFSVVWLVCNIRVLVKSICDAFRLF